MDPFSSLREAFLTRFAHSLSEEIVGEETSFARYFLAAQPYAEVLILHPSAAADGYRIQVTYYDSHGVKHEVTRDVVSQTTSDDRPLLELFWIDAANVSATVTPYRLQPGSISAP